MQARAEVRRAQRRQRPTPRRETSTDAARVGSACRPTPTRAAASCAAASYTAQMHRRRPCRCRPSAALLTTALPLVRALDALGLDGPRLMAGWTLGRGGWRAGRLVRSGLRAGRWSAADCGWTLVADARLALGRGSCGLDAVAAVTVLGTLVLDASGRGGRLTEARRAGGCVCSGSANVAGGGSGSSRQVA